MPSPHSYATLAVEQNLLLLLSASLPAESISTNPEAQISRLFAAPGAPVFQPAHSFARRILENLASLTYHHVSPNTLMLSKKKPRLSGGSDAASARVARSRLGKAPSASLAASLSGLEASGDSIPDALDDTEHAHLGGSQRLLAPLQTSPRPVRGPVVSDARTHPWDGQRPQKHIDAAVQALDGESAQVQARVEAVRSVVAELERDDALPESDRARKMPKHVREEKVKTLANLRANLKMSRTKRKRRVHDEWLAAAGKDLLLEVVQGAAGGYDPARLERIVGRSRGSGEQVAGQARGGEASASASAARAVRDGDSERARANASVVLGPLLGAKRWQRWFDGKFLPP